MPEQHHPDQDSAGIHLEDLVRRVLAEGVVTVRHPLGTMVCLSQNAFVDLQTTPGPTAGGVAVAAGPGSLSARELQVLDLLRGGLAGSEVADHLGVDVRTVARHLSAARRKLGTTSTRDAIARAVESGLLDGS